MKKTNLPIFIPHVGCKNECSFCNQRMISGTLTPPAASDVAAMCETALESLGERAAVTEIAFFGGSFTAVPRDYMLALLEAAKGYVERGFFGIRISTRPDCIDSGILELLKENHVTSIELGAQSMRDEVLIKNRRGHTAEDVKRAGGLIKSAGIELGLQMMTGLYGDDDAGAVYTANELIKLKPATVRIYPTVTLKGTYLEKLYIEKKYTPSPLDQQVLLCAKLLGLFEGAGITVIRLGLQADAGLDGNIAAGAYHPAFRELVEGEMWYERLLDYCLGKTGVIEIEVPAKARSKAAGHGNRNIKRLRDLGYQVKIVSTPSE